MDRIKSLFNEVKLEMIKVAFINTFLDTVMMFLLAYFVTSFFNIKLLYTILIPGFLTLVFFIISFSLTLNKMRLKQMEDANPQVKEMLRTAHDNMSQDNIMMAALFEELKKKMKTVSTGNLLESKRIIVRIISAVVIVFLIVFVSAFSINLRKIDLPFDKLRFMIPGGKEAYPEGNITDLVFNETEVMYGEASIAKLGNDQISLNMNPSMSEIDFNQVSETEKDELREGSVPQEIGVNPDAFSSQEVLDEAEQAANYTQRIKNI
ncbi:MAG TPA: hypothetical protein VJ461_00565 [Candidatus Nanoarchaeia archaeon]|nr:hypothetical protein [Candidatus Nanoarchaeia archaeon]